MGSMMALWALLGVMVTPPAEAPARFVIDPPVCAPDWLDTVGLERMLSADTSTQTKAYIALIIPECADASIIEFTVLRPGRPPEGGHVQLSDVPTAVKLRTFALAVAERLVFAPLARPARVPVRRALSRPVVKVPRPRVWSLVVRSKILAGLQRGEIMGGVSMGIARRLQHLDLELEVTGATGQRDVSDDAAQLWLADAQITTAWFARGLGATWRAGPQAGLGFGQLSGQPAQGSQPGGRGRSTIAWVGGVLSSVWDIRSRVAIEAQLHARTFILGIDGQHLDEVVVGLSGPYAGLSLGLRWTM